MIRMTSCLYFDQINLSQNQRYPILPNGPRSTPILSITALGKLSCVNKKAHEIARQLFLIKARELALNPTTTDDAIEKLRAMAMEHAKMSWSQIFICLAHPHWYKNPHQPQLELLETPAAWPEERIGAALTAQDKMTQALSLSLYYKRPQLVRKILKQPQEPSNAGITPHPENYCGYGSLPPPLTTAILSGDLDLVEALLKRYPKWAENPAVIQIKGVFDYSFEVHIYLIADIGTLSHFEAAMGGPKALDHDHLTAFNLPMIHTLLRLGVKPNGKDLIAAKSHPQVMELLKPHDVPLGKEKATQCLFDALQHLGRCHRMKLDDSARSWIEYLIEEGADLNHLHGDSKRTVLSHAAYIGCVKLVKILLLKGASPIVEGQNEKTAPLKLAQKYRYKTITRLLKKHIHNP